MTHEMTKLTAEDQVAKLLQINLIEVAPGYAMAKMEIKESHLNGWVRFMVASCFLWRIMFSLLPQTAMAPQRSRYRRAYHITRPRPGPYLRPNPRSCQTGEKYAVMRWISEILTERRSPNSPVRAIEKVDS